MEPSEHDILTTQRFLNICMTNGIVLNDHIILNESEHYSFKKNGLIDNMLSKYNVMFAGLDDASFVIKNNKKQ